MLLFANGSNNSRRDLDEPPSMIPHGRHGGSWYDALIVAAALEAECHILYSEDFQNPLIDA